MIDFDQELLEIYGALDHDRLMELVVRYASDRLDAGGSSVFLRDDITGRYVLRGTTGLQDGTGMPAERVEYALGEGLTGWIVKHGQPLRVANPRDRGELLRIADDLIWSRKYSEVSAKPGLAYLGVPVLSRRDSAVLGVLRVSGKAKEEQFNERDEALLGHIAAMVSIAIENSQRFGREKRRARYFRLLLDISSELNPRRPIAEMLQAVADRVRRGFRTEACLIYLRAEEDVHQAVLRAASGLPEELITRLTYMAGEGMTGHILKTGRPVQIRERIALKRWRDRYVGEIGSHLPSGVYRSFIGVPLRLGGQILGTFELVNKIPSRPGHRDWFTDDDREYLLLLSTAIGGVLEGARYLKALNDVGITAMRMQRIASFGSLAQRIRHEASNPLAVARLGVTNLRGDFQNLFDASPAAEGTRPLPAEQAARLARRLDIIEASLSEVSGKMLELLKFSQRIGFVRTTTHWNDVVREVLIWLSAERQRRSVEVHVSYGDLPTLYIEPNELFGVMVTIMHLAMEALGSPGGLVAVRTSTSCGGKRVRTEVRAPDAALSERVSSILAPAAGTPEELSPLHFEWALAQETVEAEYAGSLTWKAQAETVSFVLELPLSEN